MNAAAQPDHFSDPANPPAGSSVVVAGDELCHRVTGTGSPVVLIHGWPTSSLLWTRQIAALATRHRVFAPDLPGFGQSPQHTGSPPNWSHLADTLLAYLDALDLDRPAVVGHDIGAVAALLATIRQPDRISRLAILNTTPYPRQPQLVRLLIRVAKTPLLNRLLTTRIGFWALFRIGTANHNTDVRRIADRHHDPIATEPDRRRTTRAMLASLDPRQLADLEPGLSRITCPVLILWGEQDPTAPTALAERLHNALPNSTLRTIAHGGHFLPEDIPGPVNEHLADFLATTPSAGSANRELPREPNEQQHAGTR